jgi:hypothetical protein
MTDFIYTQTIEQEICDELIDYFENNPNKFVGQSAFGVDKNIKDSTDCYLEDVDLSNRYFEQLKNVVDKYIEKFPYCNNYGPWGISDSINIQKYPPNGGFHAWHTERAGANGLQSTRHLVFMTYLNDVNDGGGTEFYHQQKLLKAKKGVTVIWPADWTHTHRGVTSPSETKYIITGWFNFGE